MKKRCSRCKKEKIYDDFHKDKYNKTGYRYDCKECVSLQNKNKKRKKTEFTCSSCKKTKLVDYYTDQRRKTTFCNKCLSKEIHSGKKRPELSGKNSPLWNGGEYISSDGYKMIKCEGESHPSGKPLYKREHILIYEEYTGKKIRTQRGYNGEQIHHIDGDKLNNNIDNLILCKNTKEHREIDHQLHRIALDLVKSGIIIFNKDNKEYILNESRIT